ncbi:tryptophan 2,3-dioxygenase family protein [Rhizorhabdus dicambivorans]|uniref:Tryptophan 2,3-dioxygenase n=1 Tax=Rhizorhabdus dicambivorans TaxID=1850238 RepID=A0A2A4FVG4_9SPHN|nr:tryptophan 2,3-dioxygenase family protein [Rhizorhabdus dicambivorans]ATE64567.1 tryptophan 2,3-dioxygenase [Rhizorhabdus dicambivorans]PCE41662.1 tryptophan 2,3-dioxygenase [Rhizorhabdus dicambivorans]
MDRNRYYEQMQAPEALDYEVYLRTGSLLACQKAFDALCNRDELQFQIVHQVEELWMKLMAYTLLDIDDYLQAGETHRVITLMGRCHKLLKLMIAQLDLLETMSPKEYQEIRLQLGNGSGQESPGFRVLLKMVPELWRSFEGRYLKAEGRTVRSIYDQDYRHDAAYAVAEALIEFDELFGKFRWHHLFLIQRSIGMGSASLKGRPVDLLQAGAKHRFFPELWDVRVAMTDDWGDHHGRVRDSISHNEAA